MNADSAPTTTEVRFLDGARGSSQPIQNSLYLSHPDSPTEVVVPDVETSFVFVNGRLQIVPDIILFIRGDSNGDGVVNISDAQTTLSYLFLGSGQPRCYDAADANDDGRLDVSDPVITLRFLFLGGDPLPEPSGQPGEDPTPDPLGCLYRSQ